MNCTRVSVVIACADYNTHVITSQSSQSEILNFLTWSDLDVAFGFVHTSLLIQMCWFLEGIAFTPSKETGQKQLANGKHLLEAFTLFLTGNSKPVVVSFWKLLGARAWSDMNDDRVGSSRKHYLFPQHYKSCYDSISGLGMTLFCWLGSCYKVTWLKT